MQAQCEMESACWFRDCLLSQIVVGPWRQRASLRPGPRDAFLRGPWHAPHNGGRLNEGTWEIWTGNGT